MTEEIDKTAPSFGGADDQGQASVVDRNRVALMRDEEMRSAASATLSSQSQQGSLISHTERLLAAMTLEQLDRRTSPDWAGTRTPGPVNDRIAQLEAAVRELCNIAEANIFTPVMSVTGGGGVPGVAGGGVGGPVDGNTFLAVGGTAGGGIGVAGIGGAAACVANPTVEYNLVVGAVGAAATAPNVGAGGFTGGQVMHIDTGAPYRAKARVAELRRLVDGEAPEREIELARTRRPGEWWRLVVREEESKLTTPHVRLESISDISLDRGGAWAYACDLPHHHYSSNVTVSGWSALLDQVVAAFIRRGALR